jgi:hypothetical protein
MREHEQAVSVTDGGLRRAAQPLAAKRLALGLIKAPRRGARQSKPQMCQRLEVLMVLVALRDSQARIVDPWRQPVDHLMGSQPPRP